MNTPLVDVNIAVYNHAPYLRKTLDSVLAQKTNFNFRMLVGDDASTDGSIDILKEYESKYPDLIKVIYQEKNLGLQSPVRNGIILYNNSTAKYIALLDGDDYWIDSNKLQKQVDFLENHPDYSVSFTNAVQVGDLEEEGLMNLPALISKDLENQTILHEDLLKENRLITCTTVFRKNLSTLPDWFYKAKFGDWLLHVINSSYGKVKYIKDITGAYRVHNNGAFSTLNQVKQLQDYNQSADVLIKNFPKPQSKTKLKIGQKGRILQILNILYAEGDKVNFKKYIREYFRNFTGLQDILQITKPLIKYSFLVFGFKRSIHS